MKKVSIIIPNYNGAKFIQECLDSVVRQDYPEKEIIIIDDGSTDGSLEIIQDYIKTHKKDKTTLICQNNLNAAIARNRGMEVATGDYYLFLDSDDSLQDNCISYLVNTYEQEKVDLVIGNYTEVNEKGKKIRNRIFTTEKTVLNAEESFGKLVEIDPVPSNKLYNARIINDNHLEWGNVRIGQDLNFYYKYLSLCKNVVLIDSDIYKYRINNNSMTRTYDFRIFDIVNSFSDVERFYRKNNRDQLYRKYVPVQALRRFGIQLDKQIFYAERCTRSLIVNYFSINEKNLDYSLCNKDKKFKKMHRKFRIKCAFRFLLTSEFYRKYTLNKRKRNGQ